MAEELADILRKFALSEEELGGAALDLGDVNTAIQECEASLVGKIVVKKWLTLWELKILSTRLGGTLRIW